MRDYICLVVNQANGNVAKKNSVSFLLHDWNNVHLVL